MDNKYRYIVISAQNRLKSRPTFTHLLPQRDKAALYLAEGRSHNLKIISGKPDNFQVGLLWRKYAHGVPARRPDAQRAAFCVAKSTEWGRSYTLKRQNEQAHFRPFLIVFTIG